MGAKRLHRETAGQPQNRLQKYWRFLIFLHHFFRCHERAKRLETQFESVAGSDAGAVAKNGQKAEQFFPVTLGKRPTSLSGTYHSNSKVRIWQSKLC